MKPSLPTAAGLAALVLALQPAAAHHAWRTTYDPGTRIVLKGAVTSVDWINPHAFLHLTAAEPGKALQPWAVEMPTPSNVMRRGVTRQDLAGGVEVTVRVYRARPPVCTPDCRAYILDLRLPDGRKIDMASPLPAGTAK